MTDSKLNLGVRWKDLLNLYPKYNFKAIIIPLIISLIITFCCVRFSNITTYENIVLITSLINTIVPSILGFTLTGYTVIMGLGSSEVMKGLTTLKEGKSVTMFQKLNATFAFVLIIISITLIISVIIFYLSKLEMSAIGNPIYSEIVNILLYLMLVFLSIYSLFTIIDIIKNIFSFGQYTQKTVYQNNIKDKK